MADHPLGSHDPFGRVSVDGLPRRTVGTRSVEYDEPDDAFPTDEPDEYDEGPSRWQRVLVRLVSLLVGLVLLVYLLSGWNPLWSLLVLCGLMALGALSGTSRHDDDRP